MRVQKFAAFSDRDTGGNPAGVVLADELPDAEQMQAIACEVGYSETVFATPSADAWTVRYFSPTVEVPFCGHATLALGAALALKNGNGVFPLLLSSGSITVEAESKKNTMTAALQSFPTRSQATNDDVITRALRVFGYTRGDLDQKIPSAFINAGNEHLLLALNSKTRLSAMRYDFDQGLHLMNDLGVVTVMVVYAENEQLFHARNAFAAGGVYEDPATGSSAAAFAGYLRHIQWPCSGEIEIIQGEDIGMRSRIYAKIPKDAGDSIRISGQVRHIR